MGMGVVGGVVVMVVRGDGVDLKDGFRYFVKVMLIMNLKLVTPSYYPNHYYYPQCFITNLTTDFIPSFINFL